MEEQGFDPYDQCLTCKIKSILQSNAALSVVTNQGVPRIFIGTDWPDGCFCEAEE
jgi:hypothetical protein